MPPNPPCPLCGRPGRRGETTRSPGRSRRRATPEDTPLSYVCITPSCPLHAAAQPTYRSCPTPRSRSGEASAWSTTWPSWPARTARSVSASCVSYWTPPSSLFETRRLGIIRAAEEVTVLDQAADDTVTEAQLIETIACVFYLRVVDA